MQRKFSEDLDLFLPTEQDIKAKEKRPIKSKAEVNWSSGLPLATRCPALGKVITHRGKVSDEPWEAG